MRTLFIALLLASGVAVAAPGPPPLPGNPFACQTAQDNLTAFKQIRMDGDYSLLFVGPDARAFVSPMFGVEPPDADAPKLPPISSVTVFASPNREPPVLARFYGPDGCDVGLTASMNGIILEAIIYLMGQGA